MIYSISYGFSFQIWNIMEDIKFCIAYFFTDFEYTAQTQIGASRKLKTLFIEECYLGMK